MAWNWKAHASMLLSLHLQSHYFLTSLLSQVDYPLLTSYCSTTEHADCGDISPFLCHPRAGLWQEEGIDPQVKS